MWLRNYYITLIERVTNLITLTAITLQGVDLYLIDHVLNAGKKARENAYQRRYYVQQSPSFRPSQPHSHKQERCESVLEASASLRWKAGVGQVSTLTPLYMALPQTGFTSPFPGPVKRSLASIISIQCRLLKATLTTHFHT